MEVNDAPPRDDGIAAGGPQPESPPPAPPARPAWTYALLPAAIVLAAAIVGVALLVTRGGGDTAEPAAAASATVPPNPLVATLLAYGQTLGLDQAAYAQCLDGRDISIVQRHFDRGVALGVTGTPTFVVNNKLLVGNRAPEILDEIIAAELAGSPATLDGYSAAIRQLAAASPPQFAILPNPIDVSDAYIEGDPDAAVIVAEFSDFQCPFCRAWTAENIERMRARAGDEVALAFLHFPITQIHPNAAYASLAAHCASKQGKFWEMHDLLFLRQPEWGALPQR
jgi:protein-disulfide isomerase